MGEGNAAEARIRQIDELKYALRSVNMFARGSVASSSRRIGPPPWLAETRWSRSSRAEEHFRTRQRCPPTTRTRWKPAAQHPGLSEYFLYSNDDMFFGRPLKASMFFSPGGVTRFIEAKTRIGLGANDPTRSGFENAARVNRQMLFERVRARHHPASRAHRGPAAPKRADRDGTRISRGIRSHSGESFRSGTDISVTNSFYHYYALMTGRAVQQEKAKVLYVNTTTNDGLNLLSEMRKRRGYDFFCLNDSSFPEVSAPSGQKVSSGFLERYFPIPGALGEGRGGRRQSSKELRRRWTSAPSKGARNKRIRDDGSINRPLSVILRCACSGEKKVPTVFPDQAEPRSARPCLDIRAPGCNLAHRLCRAFPGGDRQILGIAGSRGDRDRDADEGGIRRVVQVPGQNGANIGALEHPSERSLVAEFHRDGQVQDTRNRRMMHRQNGAVRGLGSNCRASQSNWSGDFAVMMSGTDVSRVTIAARRSCARGPGAPSRAPVEQHPAQSARSSWLPITQTSSEPSSAANGSIRPRNSDMPRSPLSVKSPVKMIGVGA